MKYICFFSNGNNGDIIHSKSFIEDITNQLDTSCLFHHTKSPKISQDLSAIFTQIKPSNYYEKFIETEKIFFINTWLYPYLMDSYFDFIGGINLETNYKIYHGICEVINQKFNKNIKLKDLKSYFPYINFNNVEKNNIDKFVENNPNKKVLFCNGPCLSGQTSCNDNFSDFIHHLSEKYKNIIFIATQKFETDSDNIVFTDDIINIDECDLNEIGYLSTFCNLIIGKNSGPFCFSTIKENYNNLNTIFYAFGHNKGDCFHGNIDINAKFIFNNSENQEDINFNIDQIIQKNLIK